MIDWNEMGAPERQIDWNAINRAIEEQKQKRLERVKSLKWKSKKKWKNVDDIMYGEHIERFMNEVSTADEETLNKVFYLTGRYDFDETNPTAIEIIADIFTYRASRTSSRSIFPYIPIVNPFQRATPENGVYKNPIGTESFLPSRVADRVIRRRLAEASGDALCQQLSSSFYDIEVRDGDFLSAIEAEIHRESEQILIKYNRFPFWLSREPQPTFSEIEQRIFDNDTRYDFHIEYLTERLPYSDDESKDSIFYKVGKYDFDERNPEAVRIIAELFFARLSSLRSDSKYPYKPKRDPLSLAIPENGVYRDPTGHEEYLPEYVAARVLRRKSIEAERKRSNKPLYIPNIDVSDFAEDSVWKAVKTSLHPDYYCTWRRDSLERVDNFDYGASEPFIVKDWRKKSDGQRLGMILGIIVILFYVFAIIGEIAG